MAGQTTSRLFTVVDIWLGETPTVCIVLIAFGSSVSVPVSFVCPLDDSGSVLSVYRCNGGLVIEIEVGADLFNRELTLMLTVVGC